MCVLRELAANILGESVAEVVVVLYSRVLSNLEPYLRDFDVLRVRVKYISHLEPESNSSSFSVSSSMAGKHLISTSAL